MEGVRTAERDGMGEVHRTGKDETAGVRTTVMGEMVVVRTIAMEEVRKTERDEMEEVHRIEMGGMGEVRIAGMAVVHTDSMVVKVVHKIQRVHCLRVAGNLPMAEEL